jgi:spore coat polysaccharide biosynthesis predicted glycosyltransferase SpsG
LKALKIAFRIDISPEIGTGHYVRMSALAEVFEESGHSCIFFKTADEPVDYSGFDVIIADSYELSDEYIAGLNSSERLLVCYDDNALYNYNCDVIVNANLYANELSINTFGKTPRMLLGGEYALLRCEFRESTPIVVKKQANRVFVCFGGTDLRNITPCVVATIQEIEGIELAVVLGGHTKCDDEVRRIAKENVVIYKTPKSICEIMQSCDIAVTSSGSMVYELATLGLPSIIMTQADNQVLITDYMSRNALMKSVGDWQSVDFGLLKREVSDLLHDFSRRKRESSGLRNSVDKGGAENVMKKILNIILEKT